MVRTLTFAPWRISSAARDEWPCRAATWRGVKPSALQLLTPSAPASCRGSCRAPETPLNKTVCLLTGESFIQTNPVIPSEQEHSLDTDRVDDRGVTQTAALLHPPLDLSTPTGSASETQTHKMVHKPPLTEKSSDQLTSFKQLTISTSPSATARSNFSTWKTST